LFNNADLAQPFATNLAGREVYRKPWLRVREDEILWSNAKPGIYGGLDKNDCAIILAIDRIWLLRSSATPSTTRVGLPQGERKTQVETLRT